MFDHGSSAVKAIHGGDGEEGDPGPGPHRGYARVEIEGGGLPTGCEVDAAADDVFPPPAVESVVTKSGDDPAVGHQPRTTYRSEAPAALDGAGGSAEK